MRWKTVLVVLVALVAGVGVLVKIATRVPAPPAHQVFINGDVFTMDADNRIVEALSVREDRIEAVGSTEEIMALAGARRARGGRRRFGKVASAGFCGCPRSFSRVRDECHCRGPEQPAYR